MSTSKLPISLCYILRDEEEFLEASVKSAAPFAQELLFLDSGSKDRTKEIAFSFRNSVDHFEWQEWKWQDDFSLARNRIAALANQDWIFFLDGDEVLDSNAKELIAPAIQNKKVGCYSVIQRNYTRNPQIENGTAAQSKDLPGLHSPETSLYYFENWMDRLYRPSTQIQFEGRIHESLIPSCQRLGVRSERLSLILHHYGRLKKNVAEKPIYYLELTKKKWNEQKENPAAWIELAITLMELERHREAFEVALQAVEKFPTEKEILKVAFQTALRIDQFRLAENWILKFLSLAPQDLYAQTQLTTALLYQKRFPEVLSIAEKILNHEPLNFVTNFNCGVIYFENRDWKNAARYLQAALRARPENVFVRNALEKIDAELQKKLTPA